MDASEFVALWKSEKDNFLQSCLELNEQSAVCDAIQQMNLSKEQAFHFETAMNHLLTDVFYTLLLGLDGCASIGGTQETYKIYDESDRLISECGDLEAEAYEQFHGHE